MALANPDGSLVFADDEVVAIAQRFPGRAQLAYGPDARRAWLLDRAAQADYLELSTHAAFAIGEPERSAFLLAHPAGHTAPLWRADVPPDQPMPATRQPLADLQAGCERLTLDDIWAGRLPLKPGCTVTADACETALIDPNEAIEESLGFPAALLGAGAGAVIASLWAVDDFSTALLMDKTYELMLPPNDLSPAAALRQARLWVRSLPRAEVLARLSACIRTLREENGHGEWARLPRVRRGSAYTNSES